MTENSFYENRYDSLQMLRGISCILVILEHVRFLNCGAFAVDIFFCLSGFMILFSTEKDSRFFLRKRLIRILPLYYLMTVGTFLLLLMIPTLFETTTGDPVYLLKSLLFIPFDIGQGVVQPLVRIGWTINCEMFFYLLFFLAMKLSHKYRGLITAGGILLLIALAQLTGISFVPLQFYGDWIMVDFLLGMLCFEIAKGLYTLAQRRPLSPLKGVLALGLAGGVIFLLMATKPYINVLEWRRPLLWGVPAALIVLCFFLEGLIFPTPRALTQLGNISFSLYLIHYYPILFLDRSVFDFSAPSLKAFVGVGLGLMLCTALAYISWALIEQGLGNRLRRLICKIS